MTATVKKQLRSALRALHRGKEIRDAQSAEICRHILSSDAYKNAHVIGGYMSLPWEADILPVLEDALAQGKTLAMPLCGPAPHMTLRRVAAISDLRPGAYGIPEPSVHAPIIPADAVELLLVPLEGIDRQGFRLGKGGGYYDALLTGRQVQTIGCALSWQWVDALPREQWDQPLKACADENGLHYFTK